MYSQCKQGDTLLHINPLNAIEQCKAANASAMNYFSLRTEQ